VERDRDRQTEKETERDGERETERKKERKRETEEENRHFRYVKKIDVNNMCGWAQRMVRVERMEQKEK
jgi:hypothetical protein